MRQRKYVCSESPEIPVHQTSLLSEPIIDHEVKKLADPIEDILENDFLIIEITDFNKDE